jgi:ribosome-binding ATPase YchF (GTP1/OBG family)
MFSLIIVATYRLLKIYVMWYSIHHGDHAPIAMSDILSDVTKGFHRNQILHINYQQEPILQRTRIKEFA